MKTLILDLNKLSKEQLQAYLMLQEVSETHTADAKIQKDNKDWMKKELPVIPTGQTTQPNELIS